MYMYMSMYMYMYMYMSFIDNILMRASRKVYNCELFNMIINVFILIMFSQKQQQQSTMSDNSEGSPHVFVVLGEDVSASVVSLMHCITHCFNIVL